MRLIVMTTLSSLIVWGPYRIWTLLRVWARQRVSKSAIIAPPADETAGRILGTLVVLLVFECEVSILVLLSIAWDGGRLIGWILSAAWGLTGRRLAELEAHSKWCGK